MSNGFIACTLKCISSFTQYWWPVQGEGGEHDRLHIDGTRVISLVPNHSWNSHLLQKNKKINMEKEKETHKTGILWMRLNRSFRPSSSCPPSVCKHAPLLLKLGTRTNLFRAARARCPRGLPTSGHTWQKDQNRQAVWQLQQRRGAAVKSVPAAAGSFQLCIRLSGSPRNGLARGPRGTAGANALRHGQALFLTSRHTTDLLNWDLNFTAFFFVYVPPKRAPQLSFYVIFSSACAEINSHLEPNPM